MTRDEFNTFCGTLGGAHHVVQWGGADVWKVGPRVFAICGWSDGRDTFTFKASEIAWAVLRDRPGIRPAPYLASRGLKWLQVHGQPGLNDADLRDQIAASYRMVAKGLTRRQRAELGIGAD